MALPLYNELPLIADLEEEEQDTQMTSSETLQPKPGVRHLPLEGAYNIRDLGGYTTTDGRTTRWGQYSFRHTSKPAGRIRQRSG